MDKKEFFAAKLAAGTAKTASKMAAWWPRHAHAGMDYLALRADGFIGDHAKVSREASIAIAHEWEVKVPSAARGRTGVTRGLMTEHTTLECELIDVMLSLEKVDKVDRLMEKMLSNIQAHTPRYAHALRGFPEERFAELLREHTSLFMETVASRIEGATPNVHRLVRRFEENAVALATITAEWF